MARSNAVLRFQDLNQVIHERTRLAILSYLIPAREASFSELKEALRLTDGNLNLHMKVLEKKGYVAVKKEFVRRRPRTTYQTTARGRREFGNYVALLEEMLNPSQRRVGRDPKEEA
jgi:predicted ArsR family transcriptional regulator